MCKLFNAIVSAVFGSALVVTNAQALDTAAVITELTGAASSVDSVILGLLAILTSLLVFSMVRKAMGK